MSAPKRFRTTRSKLIPRWLSSGEGGLVGFALDVLSDGFVERARLGLLARFPQNDPTGNTTAPPDALAAMGRDRRVTRGFNEGDVSYARRLKAWLDDRRVAGSAWSILQKIAEYMGPTGASFRLVDNSGNWYSIDANGNRTYKLATGNWNWDNRPDLWSRFWVIVYPGTFWLPAPAWGSGPAWGAGPYGWGSNATRDQIASIRGIISDWQSAGTRCMNIIVAFDPASFDPNALPGAAGMPDGTWGAWSKNVGGVQVPARLTTALYFDGVS